MGLCMFCVPVEKSIGFTPVKQEDMKVTKT